MAMVGRADPLFGSLASIDDKLDVQKLQCGRKDCAKQLAERRICAVLDRQVHVIDLAPSRQSASC